MKKKILIVMSVILFATLVFGLTACSKSKKSQKLTLTVLNYADLTVSNAAQFENWMWDTFLKDNPDVAIEKEDLFNEPFTDKTNAYIASGNVPDVMYVWPSGRSTGLHQYRLLKDLSSLVRKDNLQSKFVPVALDPKQQASGYLAMLPQGITSTHVFMVNTEVLDDCGLKPAKTYSELKAQVPVLKAKGYECVIMPNKDTWVMQSCLFSALAGRFCGEGWDERILSGQAKFTDPDFVAALDFVRALYADSVISRSALGVGYGEGPGLFATKKGAYYIDGDWRLGAFITDEQTGQALITPERQNNIRVTVFPEIPGAKFNASSSVILGVGYAMSADIPAGSAKERAAWELVKYMVGKDVSQLRTQRGGTPTPSRTDLDFAAMNLEPMQIAVGNLGTQYTTGTAVIDGVLAGEVNGAIEVGLIELAMGRRTAAQVAADVQRVHERQ